MLMWTLFLSQAFPEILAQNDAHQDNAGLWTYSVLWSDAPPYCLLDLCRCMSYWTTKAISQWEPHEWGKVRTTVCPAHLRRWQPYGGLAVQCAFQQLISKDVVEVLGHDSLLLNTAVVLDGQNDWVFWDLNGEEEEEGGREGVSL